MTGTPHGSLRVGELWRYPVKSMMGERVERVQLSELGVVGDRAWATRDEVRGGIRGAKKIGPLMRLALARYLEEPVAERVSAAEITLPDGSTLMSDDPDVNERVSAAIDHPVTLWPLRPASDLDHYRHGPLEAPDFVEELRGTFDLEPRSPCRISPRPGVECACIEFESLPGTRPRRVPAVAPRRQLARGAAGARGRIGDRRPPVPAEHRGLDGRRRGLRRRRMDRPGLRVGDAWSWRSPRAARAA